MLTNEEKEVEIYSEAMIPTVPSEVDTDTPLESLNLNWRERDLPERERTKHVNRLHPYLGKFIPQLVEVFLRKYFKQGQTVLDPFCGSGTTLVQANELGINAVGYDISAFNTLLCRAKTTKYNLNKMRSEVLDILEKVHVATQTRTDHPFLWSYDSSLIIPEIDNKYLNEWYAPQALSELLTYRHHIENGSYEYKDLLKIILCRSARSARLTTHFDLDFPKRPQTEPYWCYKHSRDCYPITQAFKFLQRYSIDTIKRVDEFAAIRTKATIAIHHKDSRKAKFSQIDGVITSPPYVGLIDYHEQHSYAYHLLGLEDKRNHEIGPAVNGSSKKAQRQYQNDIAEVFSHILRSLPNDGRIIVVANDRSNLYSEIAEMIGVEIDNILYRHVNRRTGRRSGEFYESIFIWRKTRG